MSTAKIIDTKTDEAPMLATYSLLPIVQSFLAPAENTEQVFGLSLARRSIARFPEFLIEEQRLGDALASQASEQYI